jgi:hypothetical protein
MIGLIKRLMIVVAWLIVIFILLIPGILGWCGLGDDGTPLIGRLVGSFFYSITGLSIFVIMWGLILQYIFSLPVLVITWVITGKWVTVNDEWQFDLTPFFKIHAECFRTLFNRQGTKERPWHAHNRQTPNTDLDYTRSLKELDEYLNTDEYERLRRGER